MKPTENRLIEWAITQTKTHYSNEVSLLLEHNTYCLEKDRHVRYVNTIISDAEPRINLARTFIIDGIGYDFNQVSWKSFENDANVKGYYLTVLAEANIIYAKNEAEKQRFLYLRAKLMANLANPAYMYERGLEWIGTTMDVYKNMMFNDNLLSTRKAAGFIADYLGMAVASFNQTYFRDYGQLKDLQKMAHLPDNFIDRYMLVASETSIPKLREICHEIISITRDFFAANDKRKPDKLHNYQHLSGYTTTSPDYQYLADWYQECCYYFRRIYYFCTQNDAHLAFKGMFGIQSDLDELTKEYDLPDLDVLVHFDIDNLNLLAEKLKLAEKHIVNAITSNGIKIDAYVSVDEFIEKNT